MQYFPSNKSAVSEAYVVKEFGEGGDGSCFDCTARLNAAILGEAQPSQVIGERDISMPNKSNFETIRFAERQPAPSSRSVLGQQGVVLTGMRK